MLSSGSLFIRQLWLSLHTNKRMLQWSEGSYCTLHC
jgi:hypothetical protein